VIKDLYLYETTDVGKIFGSSTYTRSLIHLKRGSYSVEPGVLYNDLTSTALVPVFYRHGKVKFDVL